MMQPKREPEFNGMAWLIFAAVLLVGSVTAFWVRSGVVMPPANHARLGNSPAAKSPTIASATPAGTDVVIGIGCASHLMAVSDLDEDREGTIGLPRVGDFDHIDWEKLAQLKPDILLTQYGGRMPEGVKERCASLHISVIDVQLNVLADIDRQANIVADALGEKVSAQAALDNLHNRLKLVRDRCAGLPRVRTAIVVEDAGAIGLIGPGSFHDEILEMAGGENVAARSGKLYLTIDREQLTAMSPDCILDLEPVPPTTPQQARQAAAYWQSVADLPAVKNNRLYTVDAPYCERPGFRAADLAELFESRLHPRAH